MIIGSRGKLACFIVLGSVLAVSAEQRPLTQESFKNMTVGEQVAGLKAATSFDSSLASAELRRVVEQATSSADADVRQQGFILISSRVGGARLAPSQRTLEVWKRDRGELSKLEQKTVEALLTDLDEGVRRSALDALANLQYDEGDKPNIGISVGRVFVDTLALALDQEPSPSVRAEITKSLALSDSKFPAHVATLESALSDPAPGVLQFALLGLARHGVQRTVSKALDLLSHDDMRVRSAAIQAVATLGVQRPSDRERIQTAYFEEADPVVKEMIRQTIAKLVK